ncbi:SpoIVB peptidase [Paenalkalicoccus suaedae]|uniref:SpoIVB peptidase n=1 Tax=Paenalkalicoccus suaedae TaxID=2592382 RepID=A0A859FE22_9BACI|nr:SpoIVB peptidase [Paenalkalicoccus suaedae]QKS70972.1 SpoIVB peptidase [Paenalkalicoccus suaedae]
MRHIGWHAALILVLFCYIGTPIGELFHLEDDYTAAIGEATTHTVFDVLEVEKPFSFVDDELISLEASSSKAILGYKNIPLKEVTIHSKDRPILYPSGASIGVQIEMDGVLIVGFYLLQADGSRQLSPLGGGLEVGDRIYKLNQTEVGSVEEVMHVLQDAKGDVISIHIVRDEKEMVIDVPLQRTSLDQAKIGLYIRDSVAGIGTLTFVQENGMFGALGHVIADGDTKLPVQIENGKVLHSRVTSIKKGASGHPGEKLASFDRKSGYIGSVESNTEFGIYGHAITSVLSKVMPDTGLPIAFAHEVEEAEAEIWTVVEDDKIEKFTIEIVSNKPRKHASSKGLVVKVTDARLLNKTGGIIQGMSGSPIIQDGKIIGAISHVFVNDPSRGYGCHIEWMLDEVDALASVTN